MNEQLFNKLKSASDIAPDKHDGSYELVQKTVEVYASMDSLNSIDYKDLDLIYYMAVGSWKKHGISFDKKRNAINDSHLDGEKKKELNEILSEVMVKANNKYYDNTDESEPSTGMFAASFQTILGAANDKNEYLSNPNNLTLWNQQIREFIAMLIDISHMNDDEEIFERAESIFNKGIRGLQAGTASQILHCLKPNTFPILNSVGRKGYSTLGVFLQKPLELKYYIVNCRNIKRFRDANFAIRNYRTFDRLFWEVVGKINFEGIIDFLRDYGGKRISVSAVNHDKVKNLGQNACNEFNDFCQIVFDKKTFEENKKARWQNSGAILEYLWYALKYKEKNDLPYSISISLEKVNGEFKLIVKLELEKGRTLNEREMFNSVAITSEKNDNIKYILYPESVSGGEILNKSEAIAKLKSHNLDRVCPVFVLSEPYIMSRTTEIADEAIEAVDALTPLYDFLVNGNIPTKVENEAEQTGDNKEVSNKTMPKNIIFYGPPGTGKTFNTMAYAVAIIEKKDFNEVKVEADEDYSKVKDRYENYKTTGLIDFVTFHQSYGYEEFIEGIKPQTENEQVTYNVEPGVFQKFCDIARVSGLQQNADYGFNSSPTIWKVSLKGTGKNDIRDYCLKNDCIRIGYDSEPSGMAAGDEFVSGKNILNAFINDMRVGDVVFSCYSNTSIDAIGVVAGDYEWKKESFQEYKRFRKVKWIYKTKVEKGKDVLDINGGKVMTLSAVYRLNNVILSDVLKIVEGDDNEIKNQKSSVPEKRENYVFIIDEINRGNISKIFGELITLIEDTKREGATEAMSLRLPYSNKEFSVPQNVYIIGTMNTADRSIAAMDTALRRRFQFEEMMPAVELLAEIQIKDQSGNDTNIDVQSILQTINRRIEALYDREHTIGHAYFMPLKVKSDIDTLADIFKNKIIPLLQEYFYDDYEKIRLVLGDNQKEKVGIPQFILREQTKAEELFGPAVSDEIEFSGGKYTYSINKGLFEDSKENYIPKEREAAFVGIYDIETAKKLFGHNQTDAKQAGEGQ